MAKKPVNHVPGDEGENTDILINVLLDRSGSMSGRENDVIGHYNKFIKEQRAIPGKATVSLVIFDTEYEQVYIDRDINEVPTLTRSTYYARGGTALLDAFGRLIQAVDKVKNKPNKVLFIINTDGEENSSREFTKEKIKELVTERQNNHDWQFLFIGAGIDAFSQGGAGIGLAGFQTFTAGGGTVGASNIGQITNSYTTNYRTTGATGQSLMAATMDSVQLEDDPDAPDTAGTSVKKSKKVKTSK